MKYPRIIALVLLLVLLCGCEAAADLSGLLQTQVPETPPALNDTSPTTNEATPVPTPLPTPTLAALPTPSATPNATAAPDAPSAEDMLSQYFDLLDKAYEENVYAANQTLLEAIELMPERAEAYLDMATLTAFRYGDSSALTYLEDQIHDSEHMSSSSRKQLWQRWWGIITFSDVPADDTGKAKLSKEEIARLECLAYTTYPLYDFLSAKRIKLQSKLYMLENYYDNASAKNDFLYPYDDYTDEGYSNTYITSLENVTKMFKELYGTGLDLFAGNQDIANYLRMEYANDNFYIKNGDYVSYIYALSAYRYIGSDSFIVVFDSTDDGVPGPDEDHFGVMTSDAYMLIERANNPYGFKVLAFTERYYFWNDYTSLLFPNDMVNVDYGGKFDSPFRYH